MKTEQMTDLEKLRHSSAHVMAAAVCRLFDNVQLDIGPSTDDGFYYDFDLEARITPDDFERIEAEMKKIIEEDHAFECMTVSRDEAKELLKDQKYKLERLADIPEGDAITFYTCGEFMDLCRGPHVESTGKLRTFQLMNVAGSYFRGHETNPMLQRLYGTAFTNPKQLRLYLKQIEEAQKRDHRRLGKDLDLYSISENVGPGLVNWHPKGARIRSTIEDFWKKEHFKNGYDLVYTPHIGKANLWETSGHLDFYREGMFAAMDIDGQEYFAKPMNCPFHVEIYKTGLRSYRELPLRWAELGTVYRYEKAGTLHGLFRVRGFTQDDAHIFCTTDQIEDEVKEVIRFCNFIWKTFGFTEVKAYLSTRPEKAVGEPERWDQATQSLEAAIKAEGLPYEIDEGGGAFYGPKIDLKVKDAIGREWQTSTIQFDFNLPERFDLKYIGADGNAHRPYMVHRALFGSMERFFGILIEHYAGGFPVWLAPEQVRVLPLSDDQEQYANEILAALRQAEIRASVDKRQGKLNGKVKNAQLDKVPYMLIIGGKEQENKQVAVRHRLKGMKGECSLEEFIAQLKQEELDKRTVDTEVSD
ncbi:threonine--tRNA ligase [Pontiella sulfatireligans]|uniref:Threonine--tRNA ligase n=1 Tax=Pontiella sulfatireligans TaxID=2750658 RepID=A0A6C2UN28_9BACT|nr:threonine--tRNA ligase [Pontiella sulfatireligans]VGO21343.1 Threonine--tRNA ligase 2 [Pontiella sulfatireligans]